MWVIFKRPSGNHTAMTKNTVLISAITPESRTKFKNYAAPSNPTALKIKKKVKINIDVIPT
ncbi:MAG: hypothetical protein LBB63_01420 [Holosporaceae bacterium]|jgi:hypothetical protein|nr:hypothetical protein [Holosporaceae bacterium]